jgi:dipicolinate synthase subunit B
MRLQGKQIGFALPEGHFSMSMILDEIRKMVVAGANVFPLFLATSDHPETEEHFHTTKHLLEEITGHEMLTTSLAEEAAEISVDTIYFDLIVVAPCPGNFLAKLVNTRTTAAPLSKTVRHLQSGSPVVLALVTNGDSEHVLTNVEQIISLHSFFLVPFGPITKKGKQVYLARLDLLYETVAQAMERKQLEPIYLEPCWLPH